jgi:hypothetical protein
VYATAHNLKPGQTKRPRVGYWRFYATKAIPDSSAPLQQKGNEIENIKNELHIKAT